MMVHLPFKVAISQWFIEGVSKNKSPGAQHSYYNKRFTNFSSVSTIISAFDK